MSPTTVQALLFACWFVLVASCALVPYILGSRPQTPRDWFYMTVTIAFILWLLAGFVFLRSTETDGRVSPAAPIDTGPLIASSGHDQVV